MHHSGDCGTYTAPGLSTGVARYARLPVRGRGRREEDTVSVESVLV